MPDWLLNTLLALGAFVGGRTVNAVGEQMKEGRELRRGLDRLTIAVEGVGTDLREIRGEIHHQVAGLKVELHDQVGGLRNELARHKAESEQRVSSIDARIDALADGRTGRPLMSARGHANPNLRLAQEMGCWRPEYGGEEAGPES
jgi:hypothetical protein